VRRRPLEGEGTASIGFYIRQQGLYAKADGYNLLTNVLSTCAAHTPDSPFSFRIAVRRSSITA
jgi:hypothetical protein